MDPWPKDDRLPKPNRPSVMRPMRGTRTPAARTSCTTNNLAKGQTGLSVAFDLPTQTGYDPDAVLSRGKVGRSASRSPTRRHAPLFDQIPLGEINTSMTINATAASLLGLYCAVAEETSVTRLH